MILGTHFWTHSNVARFHSLVCATNHLCIVDQLNG